MTTKPPVDAEWTMPKKIVKTPRVDGRTGKDTTTNKRFIGLLDETTDRELPPARVHKVNSGNKSGATGNAAARESAAKQGSSKASDKIPPIIINKKLVNHDNFVTYLEQLLDGEF